MEHQTAIELLCHCLAIEADASTAVRLAGFSLEDWNHLLRLADMQRVTPLFAEGVERLGPSARLPANMAQTLRNRWLQGAARNAYLYRELGHVLSALQEADVSVVLLKGAHLGKIVYDNLALRWMSDVDILVPEADVLRAGEQLIALGYAPSRPLWREAMDRAHHHLPAFGKENAAPIEIHWGIMSEISPERQLVNPFHIDVAGLWERAQSADIAGVNVLTLSPEDLLLHLCIHASSQHRFQIGIQPICDVAEVLRRYESTLDWDQVMRCARRWGAQNCVYLVLCLAQTMLKAPIPAGALAALQVEGFKPRYILWAKDQIFSSIGRDGDWPDLHNLARVRASSRLAPRISTFLRIVFPPRHVVARIYGVSAASARVYACYARRVRDLVRKYAGVVWRMWCGNEQVMAVAEQDSHTNALVEWLASSGPSF